MHRGNPDRSRSPEGYWEDQWPTLSLRLRRASWMARSPCAAWPDAFAGNMCPLLLRFQIIRYRTIFGNQENADGKGRRGLQLAAGGGQAIQGRHRESVDTHCVDDAKRALTAIDERHTAG